MFVTDETIKHDMIRRVDLQEVYPTGDVPLIDGSNFALSLLKRESVIDDEIPVTLRKDLGGVYSIVSLPSFGSMSSMGLVVPSNIVQTKTIPVAIEAYAPILNRLFGSNWHYERASNHLVLHYPELTITNSIGMSHKIYNLVVVLKVFRDYMFENGSPLGFRTTFTKKELRYGYVHSHLHSGHYAANNFCLGTSSILDLLSKFSKKFVTPMEFEMFLVQLKKYLEWESLEGVPYISIKSMNTRAIQQETTTRSHYSFVEGPNSGAAEDWLKSMATAALLLMEKYSDILDFDKMDGLLISLGADHKRIFDWEIEVTNNILYHRFKDAQRDWFVDYSIEHGGYITINPSGDERNMSWSVVENANRTKQRDVVGFEVIGKANIPEPTLLEDPPDTAAAIPVIKRLGTSQRKKLYSDVFTILMDCTKHP